METTGICLLLHDETSMENNWIGNSCSDSFSGEKGQHWLWRNCSGIVLWNYVCAILFSRTIWCSCIEGVHVLEHHNACCQSEGRSLKKKSRERNGSELPS